jgi:hypothetical protein
MYQFEEVLLITSTRIVIRRLADMASLLPSMDNRDCIQFLTDWKAGAEVLNADGSPAPYSDDAVKALGLGPT